MHICVIGSYTHVTNTYSIFILELYPRPLQIFHVSGREGKGGKNEKFFFSSLNSAFMIISCQIFKPPLQLQTVLYAMILNKKTAFMTPGFC